VAKLRAFSFAGISEAKRMVEGLFHPGFVIAAMGTSLTCGVTVANPVAVVGARRHKVR
jgi:hypothetical protein